MKEARLEIIRHKLLSGQTLEQISEDTGLSYSTCKRYKQNIKAEFQQMLRDGDKSKILDTLLQDFAGMYFHSKEILAEIQNKSDSESVRIQATNSITKLTVSRFNILAGIGLIPIAPNELNISTNPLDYHKIYEDYKREKEEQTNEIQERTLLLENTTKGEND